MFFLTSFEGLSYQIYVIYYAIFGLLNFRSIYFAYFHNTYLISSCCLIEWRIFLPASKATDGWIRKGKKGSHKTTFLTEKTVIEEKKDVWMRWVGEECFSSILWSKEPRMFHGHTLNFFQDFFFVKFTPLMAAEQTWDFFARFKKNIAKIKSTLVQKQARNNFWFFLCFGVFSRLFQDLCENFWGIKLGAALFKISSL